MLMAKGQETLEEAFQAANIEMNNDNLTKLLDHFNLANKSELYLLVGQASINISDIPGVFKVKSQNVFAKILRNPFASSNNDKKENKQETPATTDEKKFDFKKTYKLNELDLGKSYVLATCCRPIPGDDVLGYVIDKNVIQVHKRQCSTAATLKSNFGNRLVNVEWGAQKGLTFTETLEIRGIDKVGMMIEILRVISEEYNVNISKVTIESNKGLFVGHFEVIVHDTEDINNLVNNLMKITEVSSVHRIQQQK